MKSVIFFHRSVGHNLLKDGDIYKLVSEDGSFELSDYDQNTDTLTEATGVQRQPGFTFPGGNTRPVDYSVIFSDTVPAQYQPIQELALSHNVVAIKSCYPNSNIQSDEELETIKRYYRAITAFFAAHKTKQLIILTSPPLWPLLSKRSSAKRARQLSDWLSNEKFAKNINIFNFFDLLAAPEGSINPNVLRRKYRRWLPFDSHPNAKAARDIAPLFIAFLKDKVD